MSSSRFRFGGLTIWPRRIGGQIVVLVVLAALFTVTANTLVMRSFERPPTSNGDMGASNILFAALPVLVETSPEKRQAIVDLVNLMAPRLSLSIASDVVIPETAIAIGGPAARDNPNGSPLASLPNGLSEPSPAPPPGMAPSPGPDMGTRTESRDNAGLYLLEQTSIAGERYGKTLAVLPDGTGIYAYLPLPPEPPPSILSPQFMMANWLVLLVIVLPVALIWVVVSVSRPLRRFAKAAEEFSLDGQYTPLPETGPEEIRVAAKALNSMRQRIAVMAADRTRMLSAVGHDLRTPVTRMRLRAEFIEDEDIRTGQLRDLARMEAMIDNTLSFLRDGQVQGTPAPTDLVSLVQTLIDDFAELDAEIELIAPERLVCTLEPDSIRRMIENLVQNGLKFGTKVRVYLVALDDAKVEIRVEDNGPGIPEAQRRDMLKPFVTGDTARSNAGTGFGLGLSIVEAIARAHGGTLELGDSEMGGLSARIVLRHRKQSAV